LLDQSARDGFGCSGNHDAIVRRALGPAVEAIASAYLHIRVAKHGQACARAFSERAVTLDRDDLARNAGEHCGLVT
jgi:hypothetical protein